MGTPSHHPNRRTFLQTAAAGLAIAPVLGARSVAAEPASESASVARAAQAPLSIVDAHIHLWDLTRYVVPWFGTDPILNKSYLLQDFKDQSAGLGVDAMVYVQASWALEYSLA